MNQEKSLYQIAFELDEDKRTFKNLSQSNFQQLYPETFLRSTTRKRRQRLFSSNKKDVTKIVSCLDLDSYISARKQHTENIIDGYCSSRLYVFIKRCFFYIIRKIFLNRNKFKSDIQLLLGSDLFDAEWYSKAYALQMDPINSAKHYLIQGFTTLNDPSPLFSTRKYLEDNPDVLFSKINPLIHYLHFGILENRNISKSNIIVK